MSLHNTVCFLALLLVASVPLALAQSNPVPFINNPLVPTSTAPGGPGFTLTVNGTGFVNGATARWNGSALPTQFVSPVLLKAEVPASDIVKAGTASVTVVNPGPGGGVSNGVYFEITEASAQVAFRGFDFSAGAAPFSVAVADLNGDGKLDVATADFVQGSVSVLLGNGDGTLQPKMTYRTALDPQSVIVADFNGDGFPDLALSSQEVSGSAPVSVLLGIGDGTFQPAVIYDAPPNFTHNVVAADFNQDGKLDLAVGGGAASYTVAVLLGNGDGSFQSYINAASGKDFQFLAVGDFNRDGIPDLAATAFVGTSEVEILLGLGDGTFEAPVSYITGMSPFWVSTADLNGDGFLDLVTANDTDNTVSVLLGNGDGTFQPRLDYPIGAGRPQEFVAIEDMNGDGNLDLVVHGSSTAFSVLLGNGDATFQPSISLLTSGPVSFAASGDFNGDGRMDLALSLESGFVSVQLQTTAQLSKTRVAFPDTAVGTTSSPIDVTLANIGQTAIAISGITTTGKNSGDFAQTNDCGTSLASGASCTVSITFAPTGGGLRSALVEISDDAVGSPQVITVRGTGLVPTVSLSPQLLTFGAQQVGTTSSAQTVKLTNTGKAILTISSITVTGTNGADFAETNDCGTSVPVGGTCTISVTFTPTAAGTRTATVSVADNAPDSPQSVMLTGTGTDFTISASPPRLTILRGQTAVFAITLAPVAGFVGTVDLSCTGAPTHSQCFVAPPSVTLNGAPVTAIGEVITSRRTTPGTYRLRFSGAAGALVHNSQVTLRVK